MLSKRDRRGLAPNSSYELGRGRRREPAPSTSLWNRPRGGGGSADLLPTLKAEPVPVLVLRSLDDGVRSAESGDEKEGAFNGLGEGTCSLDTARGNGTATNGSPSPSSAAPSGPFRFGTYTPFLCPAMPLRVLFRRSATRPAGAMPELDAAASGLASRGNRWSLIAGASTGESTLWRARCVGRRAVRAGDSDSRLDGGVAEVVWASRSATDNSSWPVGDASADTTKRDREGFLIAIGREETKFCSWRTSRKSSGHLPCLSFMRSMRPNAGDALLCAARLWSPPPQLSSDSSTTRDKSTGMVSLGRLP